MKIRWVVRAVVSGDVSWRSDNPSLDTYWVYQERPLNAMRYPVHEGRPRYPAIEYPTREAAEAVAPLVHEKWDFLVGEVRARRVS